MSKLFNIPLKVLWTWNCNEAEIAIDFKLKEGGKNYQVNGVGIEAFNEKKELRVCTTDNLDNSYFLNYNRSVYVTDGEILKNIWNYWKNEGGENYFKNTLNNLPLFTKDQGTEENTKSNSNNIVLTRKQVFDLVFELEAIISMLKSYDIDVNKEQVNMLLNGITVGLEKDSTKKVKHELYRKNILKDIEPELKNMLYPEEEEKKRTAKHKPQV